VRDREHPLRRRLLRILQAILLFSLVAATGALAYAFESSLLLAVGLLTVPLVPLAWRRRLRGNAALDVGVALTSALLGVPVGLQADALAPGLSIFLLLAMAAKLAAPRSERDQGTGTLIGVVLTGVASSEAVDPAFGVLFVACVVASLAASALRTVVLQLGAVPAQAVGGGAPRARALGSHAALVLAVGVAAVVVFFLFPRLGAKLFPARRATDQRLSGFSETVGLDDIGRIKLSQEVAFRVEVEEPVIEPYWRGTALDWYDGRSWHTSGLMRRSGRALVFHAPDTFRDPAFRPAGPLRRATFYVEPLGVSILFTPGSITEVTFKGNRPPAIYRDGLGSVRTRRAYAATLAYQMRYRPSDAPRQAVYPVLAARVRAICSSVPPAVDGDRLREYARDVLREAGLDADAPPAAIAAAIARHLREGFRYTTVGERTPEVEPVEDFLFNRQAGHCEYFASAMAVLLRTVGVPSRLVTGYRGGQRNDWSGTYTVRQRDAHAWVEAHVDGEWRRFDPTPPDPEAAEAGGVGAIGEWAEAAGDWVELRWFKYVIAYDAYDQRSALVYLRAVADEWLATGELPDGLGRRVALGGAAALLVGLVAAAAWLLGRGGRWLLGRGGAGPAAARAAPPALARLLSALARRGVVRRPNETPLELARRAEASLGAPATGLAAWTERYYAGRFGGDGGPAVDLERGAAELARALEGEAGRSP